MIGPLLAIVVIVAIGIWALSKESIVPGPPDDVRQQARARHEASREHGVYEDGWEDR